LEETDVALCDTAFHIRRMIATLELLKYVDIFTQMKSETENEI
jgi:hypothetical protein